MKIRENGILRDMTAEEIEQFKAEQEELNRLESEGETDG